MRLAIDGKRLVQARTGPARWLEHMLGHWSAPEIPFDELRVYTPVATEHRWEHPPKLRHVVLPTRFTPIVWENVTLRGAAMKDDVLFGASYTIPLGFPKKSVVSIQGIYEGPHAEPTPWWYTYRYSKMYAASARRANIVLANSVSTKNDIVEYYGIDPEKIRIVYQGVGAPFGWREDKRAVMRELRSVIGFDDPYLIFVGKMSLRRHVPELIRAFAEARAQLPPNMRLLLVGPNHVGLPLAEHIAKSGVAEWITHIPHLEQEPLALAYSGATAFFLPTTHEGLSATILEAMACGTPVITVDHAPLHEGFIEHVWALETPDVALMRDAMIRVACDQSRWEELSGEGRACAARFSWKRTADQTMDALWEVAKS